MIDSAEKEILTELENFVDFDPYHYFYKGRSGWCTLSLKIALWALHWSFEVKYPVIPPWLPLWPFKYHGFRTLLWIVLIGADADTYGAIGGPLLAAYHPKDIPKNFTQSIKALKDIDNIFKSLYGEPFTFFGVD